MRIVFASLPGYGHVYPMMPLALAFAEAGAEVSVAVGDPFLGRLPLPTMPLFPPGSTFEEIQAEAIRTFAPSEDASPFAFGRRLFGQFFAPRVVESLLPELERLRPDLVVFEHTNVGAAVAAAALGIPVWSFAITRNDEFFAQVLDDSLPLHSELDGLPRSGAFPDLVRRRVEVLPDFLGSPDAFAPVGSVPMTAMRPVPWSEEDHLPAWVQAPRERPLAYVTLGTVFAEAGAIRRAAVETAEAGCDVLVALGPVLHRADLGDLPDQVRCVTFVDQPRLLADADVVVHHGGTGTLLAAVERGLPQVLLPRGADQFRNADSLAHEGAARHVPGDAADGSIRDAVVAVLDADSPERANAVRLGALIAERPSPRDVARNLLDGELRG